MTPKIKNWLLDRLPPVIWLILSGIWKTLFVRELFPERIDQFWRKKAPVIVTFWHSRMAFLPFVYRGHGVKVLISPSRDGELVSRVLGYFGLETVRGSSSRQGAEALLKMEQAMREGFEAGITPDGPRGPAREIKPGVIELARRTGAPIVPLTFASGRKIRFKSWDRFELPLPFSRGFFIWGRPFRVKAESRDFEEERKNLEKLMNELTEEADRRAREKSRSLSGSVFYIFYSLVTGLFFFLTSPYWLVWLLSNPRERQGFSERLGFPPASARMVHPIWFHCASVGELEAAKPLITRLLSARSGEGVVISVTTAVGREQARKHFPGARVFFLPLDLGFMTRRAQKLISPQLIILFEAELWPNFLRSARRLGITVCLLNGRISEKSARGYRLAGSFFREFTDGIEFFLVKGEEDAQRLVNLGVGPEKVEVLGDLKWAGDHSFPGGTPPEFLETIRKSFLPQPGDPVLVAGSTHPGEEEILLQAFLKLSSRYPGFKLILAPRKLNRVGELERLLKENRVDFWLRSRLNANNGPPPTVLILDTIGELREVYSLGRVIFVGGTLAPVGGHNLVEAAYWGKPVLFGPHLEKQKETAAQFLKEGFGFLVRDPDEITEKVRELLDNFNATRELGEKARTFVRGEGGILDSYLERIKPYLE